MGRGLRAQDECHVGVWHLGLGSCEKAMRGVLLEKIRTRTPKIGVQSPLGNWMNRGLGDWAAQRVQTKHILENPVCRWPGDSRLRPPAASEKELERADAYFVWSRLQADLWREAFFTSRSDCGGSSPTHLRHSIEC